MEEDDNESWNCGACTFSNHEIMSVCEMCGTNKPVESTEEWSSTPFEGSEDNNEPSGRNLTMAGAVLGILSHLANEEDEQPGEANGDDDDDDGAEDRQRRRIAMHLLLGLLGGDGDALAALLGGGSTSNPASDEVIAGFPTRLVTAEDTENTCPVCMEQLVVGEVGKSLGCSHFFHAECIDTWLRTSARCPVCNGPVGDSPSSSTPSSSSSSSSNGES